MRTSHGNNLLTSTIEIFRSIMLKKRVRCLLSPQTHSTKPCGCFAMTVLHALQKVSFLVIFLELHLINFSKETETILTLRNHPTAFKGRFVLALTLTCMYQVPSRRLPQGQSKV